MCRHIGYLGPAVGVGEILTRGTHSLRTQAWAPRDMRGGGTINVDGFGVAWWTADGGVSRYRNAAPIWTDPAVDEVLPQLSSTGVLGAVRSATIGMPVERSANAPFTHGRWAFSHNGTIPGWQDVLSAVATEFGSPPLLEAESRTDAAALWVIVRGLLDSATAGSDSVRSSPDAIRPATGTARSPYDNARPGPAQAGLATTEPGNGTADPALALARVVGAALERAPKSRLNLLLGDGETLWATTAYHSLSVLVTDETAVVASEPYDDDPRWRAVADRQVLTLRPGHLSVVPLYADERALS
ncbi:class II glutamine amidotransferase [Nocardia alni]|uniref:class II glutamine amidotransferase n=1 Tax=Nocardia alni TaxID=2815723 RepID=UPI001C23D10D|nr:class II glutamine amidotransferase [Nocardia alni]